MLTTASRTTKQSATSSTDYGAKRSQTVILQLSRVLDYQVHVFDFCFDSRKWLKLLQELVAARQTQPALLHFEEVLGRSYGSDWRRTLSSQCSECKRHSRASLFWLETWRLLGAPTISKTVLHPIQQAAFTSAVEKSHCISRRNWDKYTDNP
jgi:hypothetical protein